MATIFLSHAATDFALAEHLRAALVHGGIDSVFMASKVGHITPGDPFYQTILSELASAKAYLVLLTPASKDRLWVSFETGATWMSGRPRVLLCAAGLRKSDVPAPLSELQLLSLDEGGAEHLAQVFKQLGARVPDDVESFLSRAKELAQLATKAVGWKYVSHDNRIFAWEGPSLDGLSDLAPESLPANLPPELNEAIVKTGVTPFWVHKHHLGERVGKGAHQVFLTDMKSWRRPIVNQDTVLMVGPPESKPNPRVMAIDF